MSDLPGILPPDAGRLERAARRYAIAVLSRRMAGGWYLDALASIDWAAATMRRVSGWVADDGSTPITSASHARPSLRLLRARVALYLRWCERVERMRDMDEDAFERYRYSIGWAWWGSSSFMAPPMCGPRQGIMVRWAVPLWTLAPAHDPAVGPAERRKRKENR